MTTPLFDNSLEDLSTEKKIFFARTNADWYLDDTGWYAPNGQHETEWEGEYPEEKLF